MKQRLFTSGMAGWAILTLILIPGLSLHAQRGKDGAGSITAAGTIVNEFTYLTADAAAGSTTLTVSSSNLNANSRFPGPLAPGDLIFIIQMQGATLDGVPDDIYYGAITAYNNCGLYEFAEVRSVPGANTIEVDCGLTNPYTASGNVQVIRVPRYASLTVNSGGVLTTSAWDGQTGGALVVEVEGNATINAGGSVDAGALGFRGGQLDNQTDWGFFGARSADSRYGAEKGEGIGGYQAVYDNLYNGRYSRGAPGNGGGGGNSHNGGGGGGANGGYAPGWYGLGVVDASQPGWVTAWELEFAGMSTVASPGGGRGGYTWSNSNQDATVVGPGDAAWSGDARKALGGWGGRPLDYTTGRLFLGGGGGAGDQNNNDGGAGGNGGGLIYIMSYGDITGAGQILSDGQAGGDACCATNTQPGGNDGPGGGGAGGTIILNAVGTANSVTVRANGGRGGNQLNRPPNGSVTEAEGGGGGGSGGHIAISSGAITETVNGGPHGTTNSPSLTEFPPNGATGGAIGNLGYFVDNFDISVRDTAVCYGGSVDVSALLSGTIPGGLTVVWWDSLTGGNVVGNGNPLTVGPLLSDTTLYVSTCPGTFRLPLNITVTLPTNFDAGTDASICTGSSTQLNATGGTGYVWSPTTGLSNPNIANPIANPPSTTTYYVTITDANGCSGVDSVTVSVGASLSITLTADTGICQGDSIQLQASGGGNKFTWTPAGTLSNDTIWNPYAKPTDTTKYYVLVEDTVGGCSVTDSVEVLVHPVPVADAGMNVSLCMGDSMQLNGSGGGSYLWWPGSSVSDSTIADPWVNPTITATYWLNVTGAGGCSASDSVIIAVDPKPTAQAGNNVTICPGGATTLNGSGGGFYLWTPSAGLSDPGIANPVASPSGTTTYWLTVTNAFGCSDSDSVVVTIGSNLSVAISADTAVCPGESVQLMAGGGTSFIWTPSGTLDNDTISNPVATPVTTGYYVVQVSDTSGCAGSDSVLVTVHPPASADAGSNTTICQGDSVQLSGSGGTSYLWSPAGDLDNPNISNPWANPSGNATYYVTVTDANGCSDSDSVMVSLSPPPTVNFANTGACLGDSIFFTDLSSSAGGSITGWQWDFGDGGTDAIPDPAHLYGGTGTYLVNLVVTDALGCTNSTARTVTVGNRPTVNFNDTASGCGSVTVTFNNFSNGGTQYLWDFGDGSTSSQFGPTHTYGMPGSYDVKLVVTNTASGCSDSLVFTNMIQVFDVPTADFTASSWTVSLDNPAIQFTDLSSGGSPCPWDFGDGATSTAINPVHTFADTGCYNVLLTVCSADGCKDTTARQVCVIDDSTLDIPNTITPNNDGANDTWIIENLDKYPGHVIELYNRNGNLLATFTNYQHTFNGIIDGKELPAAPYYYVLDLGDGSEVRKGILSVIR